jgi:hypothetical protein
VTGHAVEDFLPPHKIIQARGQSVFSLMGERRRSQRHNFGMTAAVQNPDFACCFHPSHDGKA